MEALSIAAKAGNLAVLQASTEHPGNASYWNAPHGRSASRYLASYAAEQGRWETVTYFCSMRGVPVDAVRVEGGLWLTPMFSAEEIAVRNLQITPLIGAILGGHLDLALHLLTLPEQGFDPNRRFEQNRTILQMCAAKGSLRLVKELMQRGADMDLCDDSHDTALCVAATYAHVPVVRFLLKQYKARGESELERAIHHPCGKEGLDFSLLGHAVKGCEHDCDRNSKTRVKVARYLVRECGADIWKPDDLGYYALYTDGAGENVYAQSLPLHNAAFLGAQAMVAFFIEECNMPVDTVSDNMTPLLKVCRGMNKGREEDYIPLLQYLVEKKGANLTLEVMVMRRQP